MATDHRIALAGIRRFDQLVDYLRDEMGWPIASESFDDVEDLFYDFTPEELGIDATNAAKIQEIKRLRPLSTHQPWGIFFVKFEPKRLPVVALRRILSQVALKRRASANSAERAAWSADDLLFVSNYGEGESRQISFAHFSQSEARKDLPTLKVLGWDNLDTPLHLDRVAELLTERLAWPDDEEDEEEWRKQWRSAFTLAHREVITTSKKLSIELAALARIVRDRINTVLAIETEEGPVSKLMAAFKEALVHDLDADGFADMYAQTITYGLLSARVTNPRGGTVDDTASAMPVTNPFLKELMESFLHVGGRRSKAGGPGIDFDELGVSEVVELLDEANMEAVVRDFGDRNPQEDPVIYFYEGFAKEYDPIDKVRCGEFYTPRQVVTYIVGSVDELLRTEFGLQDGLADISTWGEIVERCEGLEIPEGASPDRPFVQILDPATGTGTFLVEVVDVIHRTMVEKWRAEGHNEKKIQVLWNEYVPKGLLPRLHAYELKMAPYAIAHLKMGLKLHETGYRFGSEERARVYLTNALNPASDIEQMKLEGILPALAHEAQEVNEVKRNQRFTVVIGNPPYSGLSSNMNPWIDGLLKGQLPDGTGTASYYHVDGKPLGERKLWLQDDYVKFIRLSQWLLDSAGVGVHGYVTNHGYLNNPTFRGMRWSLMRSFDGIRVLDLHGNVKKREAAPDGRQDGNVFDIQQGVAIGLFVKREHARAVTDLCLVKHSEMWGDRQGKYDRLLVETVGSTDWQNIDAVQPFYLLEPFDRREAGDYDNWQPITKVMPVNVTGIVTARDHFVIDFDEDSLLQRMTVLRDVSVSDETIRDGYFAGKGSRKYPPGDSRGWKLPDARRKVSSDPEWDRRCLPIHYRPFDERQIYYVPWMIDWPRTEAMPHMLEGKNIALVTSRMTKGETFRHAQVTRNIAEVICMSPKTSNNGFVFPLYLYPGVGSADQEMFDPWSRGRRGRRPNLDPEFVRSIERITSLEFVSDGRDGTPTSFGPEDVLGYIYALFHSPEYRRRFESMLRIDFPRVPLPGSPNLFRNLARLGSELVVRHLLESPETAGSTATHIGLGNPKVGRVGWSDGTVWLNAVKTNARAGHRATKPGTIGFHGVPEEVWDFHIGGYQVCHKWLKDRKGRTLSDDDIAHYQKIIVALSETIPIMQEIDDVIEAHGGWPGAFQASTASEGPDASLLKAAETRAEYE